MFPSLHLLKLSLSAKGPQSHIGLAMFPSQPHRNAREDCCPVPKAISAWRCFHPYCYSCRNIRLAWSVPKAISAWRCFHLGADAMNHYQVLMSPKPYRLGDVSIQTGNALHAKRVRKSPQSHIGLAMFPSVLGIYACGKQEIGPQSHIGLAMFPSRHCPMDRRVREGPQSHIGLAMFPS